MPENKKDNLKYALCYIPFFAIFMHFLEDNKSSTLQKHINYGMILFFGIIIVNIALRSFFLGFLTIFTTLGYIIASVILGMKAYSGEEIDVEVLDNIEQKVKSKLGDEPKKKNEDVLNDKDIF